MTNLVAVTVTLSEGDKSFDNKAYNSDPFSPASPDKSTGFPPASGNEQLNYGDDYGKRVPVLTRVPLER